MADDEVSCTYEVLYLRGMPRAATSFGDTPAIAVAIGRATASPPGPTTAVATGLEDATPPSPAIARPEKKNTFNCYSNSNPVFITYQLAWLQLQMLPSQGC